MILSDFYIILYDFIGFWMDFDDFFMNRSAYTSPEINMFKMCAARGQRLREGTAHILNMLILEGYTIPHKICEPTKFVRGIAQRAHNYRL